MKFINMIWSEKLRDYIEMEISEREAINILSYYYACADKLVKIPNYYLMPCGGILISQNEVK